MISEEKGLERSASTLLVYIDRLITDLLVIGLDAVQSEHLDKFVTLAEQERQPETASMAKALSENLAKETGESRQKLLCEGLADLRDLLNTPLEKISSGDERTEPISPPRSSFAEDTELVADFLVEAREHLSLIEIQMMELERDAGSLEVLHSVFRTFHTIKGLAGFLEFHRIQEVSHEIETLLDLARNDRMRITPPVVDIVLESADYLNTELSRIEAEMGGAPPTLTVDNRALVKRVKAIVEEKNIDPSSIPAAAEKSDQVENRVIPPVAVPATPALAAERTIARTTESTRVPDTSSVRVETAKLDHLLDMVGEMVIAQSLIQHNPVLAQTENARLLADIAQLARNTAEVQRITMAMRMIPIGQLFQRTARLVRDLSRKVGKEIVLEMSGEDTELDKTIAEELSDPLLHMVRNSVDHGIERLEERIATGKSHEAHIYLRAYHQGGQVVIEIADDGRGLNREKIMAKAIQNGVIEEDRQLSDSEIYQLIFEPGFSTAEKITDVSGRGVGMDVVRRNVEKLRGRIDTYSEAGKGTTFLLRLPLTLAIIEGLVVMVGASRYVVPIFSVRGIFRPTPELLSTVQGRYEMALVRGNLLPIVRLHRRFNIPSKTVDPSEGLLVVIECNERRFCLLVDDLAGKQEVVIKSLGETFKDISGLAGCAILGDGRVGMILDMEGIYKEAAA
ncbi:MAG TPA: chemotaxis protein CheA [Edaphobacter sp.]|nr:chemotaxis protein CheA [Edaphobacter sp.]